MEISPVRLKKYLDKILSNGFASNDFDIKNDVDAVCQFIEFKNKQIPDSQYSWKRCSTINRIIVLPSYNAVTDVQNDNEPDEATSESKALKYFDEWLDCIKIKIGIDRTLNTNKSKTFLHENDVRLNWLPNNINNLYKLMSDEGFKQEDFVQDDERWGGDNFPMQEDQRKALRIYWKANPQYKFVWHEANQKTQTYFEPMENAAFKYNHHYSRHDNSGVLIIGEVNREFKNWLLELRKRLTEEKIADERMNLMKERVLNKSDKHKSSITPKKDIQPEKENQSNDLIDWNFEEK